MDQRVSTLQVNPLSVWNSQLVGVTEHRLDKREVRPNLSEEECKDTTNLCFTTKPSSGLNEK